jgi:hypothetical protein
LIDALEPSAADLGCERELAFARELATHNGADRQRAAACGRAKAAVEWLIGRY